ncbi:transcriptional repressor [Cellvibrio zantedeschiae]|uniref:Ferric uptake regulation protein n=1 Tax=Cellvibrio zantedeschiae TaxID=1237077 RepID=A0ABQ3BCD7_9GAMM|nr:Fur family transcriptional regulator [Cellvibrio zantedeschiae]GGY85819.1 transcriptional repressor [Cellvibrio zantedeschiae]
MYTLAKACSHHNHSHCISDAIQSARQLCDERGVRLTSLREQVLELVWQSHKPLGAYALMEMLAQASTRQVAPPTVYRALDFLLEEGLIHRINSLNAFIGCPSPTQKHQSHFLICQSCNVAVELDNAPLNRSILDAAAGAGFTLASHSVEINGLCPSCQKSTIKD